MSEFYAYFIKPGPEGVKLRVVKNIGVYDDEYPWQVDAYRPREDLAEGEYEEYSEWVHTFPTFSKAREFVVAVLDVLNYRHPERWEEGDDVVLDARDLAREIGLTPRG